MEKSELYSEIESQLGLKIQDDTKFFDDIGMSDLDAITFMEDFSDKFNVDLKGFSTKDYIMENKLFSGTGKKFFTAGHLYNVMQRGKWFDPLS